MPARRDDQQPVRRDFGIYRKSGNDITVRLDRLSGIATDADSPAGQNGNIGI